jgi:secondary thiamine-phosphate synthase enzyme
MITHQETFHVATDRREVLEDVTESVAAVVARSGVSSGLASVYVQGATAAIMIQENWDDSVQRDVVTLLAQLAPRGVWEHDRQDGNGDSHLKAGLVGPSETVPVVDSHLGLSRWQNVFLCEFDGPRAARPVVVTVQGQAAR